jgi:hypothetical protein
MHRSRLPAVVLDLLLNFFPWPHLHNEFNCNQLGHMNLVPVETLMMFVQGKNEFKSSDYAIEELANGQIEPCILIVYPVKSKGPISECCYAKLHDDGSTLVLLAQARGISHLATWCSIMNPLLPVDKRYDGLIALRGEIHFRDFKCKPSAIKIPRLFPMEYLENHNNVTAHSNHAAQSWQCAPCSIEQVIPLFMATHKCICIPRVKMGEEARHWIDD